jgi:hypothetical protein
LHGWIELKNGDKTAGFIYLTDQNPLPNDNLSAGGDYIVMHQSTAMLANLLNILQNERSISIRLFDAETGQPPSTFLETPGKQLGTAADPRLSGAGRALPLDVTTRNAFGGVSPEIGGGALHGATPASGPLGGGRFPGFVNHGGPVIAAPNVFSTFWGAAWNDAAHQAQAARLNQFLPDLVTSNFMNVLSQYSVGPGAFVTASFDASVTGNLSDRDIQNTIQRHIDAGTLPEPTDPNQALIIYLDENIGVQDPNVVMCESTNDGAFGYHKFFMTNAGNPCYYAVIPSLNDACIQNTCADDNTCSLHIAQTQEQRVTQVTSHEFAEMTTDPQLNAWFDPDPNNGENGDICNGQSAQLTVGVNVWTVQATYSKTDDMQNNGVNFCLSEAPVPIPLITAGNS